MRREERTDAYQIITDQIVAMLEAGVAPWRMPWNPELGMPRSMSTGARYRGVNPFLLHMATVANGYGSPYWGTFNKIKDLGGMVRKGEHGTKVIFWKPVSYTHLT